MKFHVLLEDGTMEEVALGNLILYQEDKQKNKDSSSSSSS